jgi:peroxiredoxin
MEELDELYRKHRERGLSVVAITRYGDSTEPEERRQERESSAKFARKRAFTFPVAITAEDDLYEAFQVLGIPRTALVDGDGTIVGYAVGLNGARELMQQAEQMVLAPLGS